MMFNPEVIRLILQLAQYMPESINPEYERLFQDVLSLMFNVATLTGRSPPLSTDRSNE